MATSIGSRKKDYSEKNHEKQECSSDSESCPKNVTSELTRISLKEGLTIEQLDEDQQVAKAGPRKPVPLYPLNFAPPSTPEGLLCFPNEEPTAPQTNSAMRLSMSQYVGAMSSFPGLPTPGMCLPGGRDGLDSFLPTTSFLNHQQQVSPDSQNTFIPHFVFSPRHPMGKKYFRCPQCRYYTDRKNNLKRHIGTMHQDCGKVLECCDIVFRSKAALRDHILLFHRTGYRCKHCGRNFCRKALLKRHLTVHNGQKEYYCERCEYGTSHQANLDRHVRGHVSTPVFESEEEEATESRMSILQASQHDQFNFWYLASGFRDPISLLPYQRTGSLFPQHMFSLPDRLKLTHLDSSAATSSRLTTRLPNQTNMVSKPTETVQREELSSEETQKVLSDLQTCTAQNKKRICKRPYKCSDCTLTFSNQQRFREHAKQCKKMEVVEPQRPLRYLVDRLSQSPSAEHGNKSDGEEPLCLVKEESSHLKESDQNCETDSLKPVKLMFNSPLYLPSEEDIDSQASPEVEKQFYNHYFPFSFPPYRPLDYSPLTRTESFSGFRPFDRVEPIGSSALGGPVSAEGSPSGPSTYSPRPSLEEPDETEGTHNHPGETGSSLPLKKRLVHS